MRLRAVNRRPVNRRAAGCTIRAVHAPACCLRSCRRSGPHPHSAIRIRIPHSAFAFGIRNRVPAPRADVDAACAPPAQVRQLEAIIRISESVAKMRLSDVATEDDVASAIQMFTVSTLRAAKMGDIDLEGATGDGAEHTAEEMIRKRVQILMVVSIQRLLSDLNAQGIDKGAAQRALNAMVRQGDFQEVGMGKKVKRLR